MEDVDAMVTAFPRPTATALAAVGAIQDDPELPCWLSGLPLVVDLLADRFSATAVPERPGRAEDELIDADGLRLLVPPFGSLLARASEEVVLTSLDGSVPEIGSLALEHRAPEKRASDGEDAVRLVEAFGSLALLEDLRHAVRAERSDLTTLLSAVRGSGLAAQAKVSGHVVDAARLEAGCQQLLDGLGSS